MHSLLILVVCYVQITKPKVCRFNVKPTYVNSNITVCPHEISVRTVFFLVVVIWKYFPGLLWNMMMETCQPIEERVCHNHLLLLLIKTSWNQGIKFQNLARQKRTIKSHLLPWKKGVVRKQLEKLWNRILKIHHLPEKGEELVSVRC